MKEKETANYCCLKEAKAFETKLKMMGLEGYIVDENGRLRLMAGSAAGTVVLPAFCKEIPNFCMFGKLTIKTVKMSSGVTSIGTGAMAYCENLNEVIMSASLETIGANAFYGCSMLKEISLYDGLKSIGANAFAHTGIKRLVIPESVKLHAKFAEKIIKDTGDMTLVVHSKNKKISTGKLAEGSKVEYYDM